MKLSKPLRLIINQIKSSNDDFQFLCGKFTATIKMLEKDKRYDSKWIKEYEMKTVMEDFMEENK